MARKLPFGAQNAVAGKKRKSVAEQGVPNRSKNGLNLSTKKRKRRTTVSQVASAAKGTLGRRAAANLARSKGMGGKGG